MDLAMSRYPELLKACTLPLAPGHCRPYGESIPDSLDDVRMVPTGDGVVLYAGTGGGSRQGSCLAPLPMEADRQCVAWIQKCSEMDFFHTFPEVPLLYSPYSAVSRMVYATRPNASVSLFPGGATVPEHCLTQAHIKPRQHDWLPIVDPERRRRPVSTGGVNCVAGCPVPTKSGNQVFRPAAAYSCRTLIPELVPSDVGSTSVSYHVTSDRPYSRKRSGSNPNQQKPAIDKGGRATPSIDAVTKNDVDEANVAKVVIPDLAECVKEQAPRPASVLSQIQERPDSGLSNSDQSLPRPESSLSHYNYSRYDVPDQSICFRPDSASSQFSELDSGIEEFRSRSTTPPCLSQPDSRSTVLDPENDDGRSQIQIVSIGHEQLDKRRIPTDLNKSTDAHQDDCDENHVTSTSDDMDIVNDVDSTQTLNQTGSDIDEDGDDGSVLSGLTSSSGHLMIDTNSELDDEEASCDVHVDPVLTRERDPDLLDLHVTSSTEVMTAAGNATARGTNCSNENRSKHSKEKQSERLSEPLSGVQGSSAPPSSGNRSTGEPTPNPSHLGAHLSGYVYNRVNPGSLQNPINMAYPPSPAGDSCITSQAGMSNVYPPFYGVRPGMLPSLGNPGLGGYPYYPQMWNYYPGVSPFMSTPYMGCMPWMMGYPGYYPRLPYTTPSPSQYMMAPPSCMQPPSATSGESLNKQATLPLPQAPAHSQRREHGSFSSVPGSGKRKRDPDTNPDVKRRHV